MYSFFETTKLHKLTSFSIFTSNETGIKDFQQIKIPVTIGLGELDKMVSREESEHGTEHLENGRLLMLPSTPHPFEKVNHQSLSGYINSFFS